MDHLLVSTRKGCSFSLTSLLHLLGLDQEVQLHQLRRTAGTKNNPAKVLESFQEEYINVEQCRE